MSVAAGKSSRPTVRILSTPASRAAPITVSDGSGQRETWECESIKRAYRRKRNVFTLCAVSPVALSLTWT